MSGVKIIQESDWRDGFFFVGNLLVLDFLNTCPVQNGERLELLSDFGDLLRWSQAAELISPRKATGLAKQWGKSARARRTVATMRKWRERLRKEVLAWEDGDTVSHVVVDELNRLMAQYPMLTRLMSNGNASSTELWFEPSQPEDLFAPLAHSCAMLFANVERHRVRKCGQCVLHFYDRSKKGNRRWCSMRFCGNRLKVAAYAARQSLMGRSLRTK